MTTGIAFDVIVGALGWACRGGIDDVLEDVPAVDVTNGEAVLGVWVFDVCDDSTRCDAVADVEILVVVLASETDSIDTRLEDTLQEATRSERLDGLRLAVELWADAVDDTGVVV